MADTDLSAEGRNLWRSIKNQTDTFAQQQKCCATEMLFYTFSWRYFVKINIAKGQNTKNIKGLTQ